MDPNASTPEAKEEAKVVEMNTTVAPAEEVKTEATAEAAVVTE